MKALLLITSATLLVANNTPTSLRDFAQRPTAPAQTEVSRLMDDFHNAAIDARRFAGQLDNMLKAPMSYDWNSHATTISQMREEINRAARIHDRMRQLKKDALPWQQFAIDSTGEALARLARATDSTIISLRRDQRIATNTDYRRDARSIYRHAEETVSLIDRKLELHELAKKTVELAKALPPGSAAVPPVAGLQPSLD